MPRVPPFYPVPTRTRRDGWTVERQADFVGMLAETGSVLGACEAVGMSRKSAYRLRSLPGADSFAAAAQGDGFWVIWRLRTLGPFARKCGPFARARRHFGNRKVTVFSTKATVLPPKAMVSASFRLNPVTGVNPPAGCGANLTPPERPPKTGLRVVTMNYNLRRHIADRSL